MNTHYASVFLFSYYYTKSFLFNKPVCSAYVESVPKHMQITHNAGFLKITGIVKKKSNVK